MSDAKPVLGDLDQALVSLDGCVITPRAVDPGGGFVYSVFPPNGNPEPVDVDLTWSFSGGVLDRLLIRNYDLDGLEAAFDDLVDGEVVKSAVTFE